MKTLLYYPGCSIKKDFTDIEKASMSLLSALGYTVIEIENWYCCGGFSSITLLDHVKQVGAFRTLSIASKQSIKLSTNTILTLCPFCYNVLKRASTLQVNEPGVYRRVAEYLKDDVEPYSGGLSIIHLVELLVAELDNLKKLVKNSLKGLRIAAYYGCMLLRPKNVAIDNPENPLSIEKVLEVLGAEPVDFPYKTYCCGAFHTLGEAEIVSYNSTKIIKSAIDAGATIIATPCPLCLYNLQRYSPYVEAGIKVLHLVDVIAHAIGLHSINKLINLKINSK